MNVVIEIPPRPVPHPENAARIAEYQRKVRADGLDRGEDFVLRQKHGHYRKTLIRNRNFIKHGTN